MDVKHSRFQTLQENSTFNCLRPRLHLETRVAKTQSFNFSFIFWGKKRRFFRVVLRRRHRPKTKHNLFLRSWWMSAQVEAWRAVWNTVQLQTSRTYLWSHKAVHCCSRRLEVPEIHCCCQKSLKSINITITALWYSAGWNVVSFFRRLNRKRRSVFWFGLRDYDGSLRVTTDELSLRYLCKLSCDGRVEHGEYWMAIRAGSERHPTSSIFFNYINTLNL